MQIFPSSNIRKPQADYIFSTMVDKKRIVVLTGAGISAESGIKTFRDSNGLWENHDIMEVASPEGWAKNPELVLRFYNARRQQLKEVKPNAAHYALVELESKYDVQIITQNVDDLHERAGSSNVLHLHGELKKVRSVTNSKLIVETEDDIQIGDVASDGGQLRPHIVWFGESVPMILPAAELASTADIFLIIGTSLVVYPAAGLVEYVPYQSPVYVIDPKRPSISGVSQVKFITERGTIGVPQLVKKLLKEA